MLKLESLVRDLETQDREAAELGKEVFVHWRMYFSADLLAAIRLRRAMNSRGLASTIDLDFCNAAALILDFASEDTQDRFLRSTPEMKRKFADCVIADGGLYDSRGHWVELPLC